MKLQSRAPGAKLENNELRNTELRIPLPAVEVGLPHGLPEAGAATSQMKVLDQQSGPRSLRLRLSAPAKSDQLLFLRLNDPKVRLHAEGAEVTQNSTQLKVHFPDSDKQYAEKEVVLSW